MIQLPALIKEREYTVILCLGDSITEANHCSEGHKGYIALLDEELRKLCSRNRFLLINAGVGGRSVTDSIGHLQELIRRFCPDVVTLMFGMNDCTKQAEGLPLYRAAMAGLIDFSRANGAKVVVFTQNPIDYRCDIDMINRRKYLEQYMTVALEVTAQKEVDCIDFYHLWHQKILDVSNNEHLKYLHDAIHPNQHGHRFFYEEIKARLLVE